MIVSLVQMVNFVALAVIRNCYKEGELLPVTESVGTGSNARSDSKLDTNTFSGLSLLGHELVHVMQQRVLRPCRTGISILWDPTLERV
jgi:hypothetical protein